MEDRSAERHPGPWRVMQVDSEFAGLLVAVSFLVLGLVSMPLTAGFVLGALSLGVVLALLLRFAPSVFCRTLVGTVIALAGSVLWWAEHKPRRPHSVSSNARYVLANNKSLALRHTGYWLECWFDPHENVDRCKLTDEKATMSFEDDFYPYIGHTPLPQSELDIRPWTGDAWIQSPDNRISVPVVYIRYGEILIPRSLYAEAKKQGWVC